MDQEELDNLLIDSVHRRLLDEVKEALEQGANVNAQDEYDKKTSIWWASHYGHTNIVQYLLEEAKADPNIPNIYGSTPLTTASYNGHSDVVAMLMKYNINIHHANEYGLTALHYAASNNHPEIIKILITNGADITAVNKDGNTALMLACMNGCLNAAECLLEQGADMNIINKNGLTALHCAAFNNHPEIIKILITNGADVTAVDKAGRTALHCAACNNHPEIIKILIANGADIAAVTKDGHTPLMLAYKQGHVNVAVLLLEQSVENDKSILLKALDEGYVILSIIKLLLVGPPAVGKTSLKHLLFNWDPPRHHHSTAIADRPIRAAERVATLDGAKTWEMITTQELMDMLGKDIRVQASLNTTSFKSNKTKDTQEACTSNNICMISIGEDSSSHAALSDVLGNCTKEESTLSIAEGLVLSNIHCENAQDTFISNVNEEPSGNDAVNLKMDQNPSATKNETILANGISNQQQFVQSQSLSLDNNLGIHTASKEESILELSKGIFSAMSGTSSHQLSESTWIYVLDSGGQPQFADVSRAFVHGNTVIVLVHKLSHRLSSKPIFQYSIDGKPLTQPKELRMTNLQLITTYVRSISSAKFIAVDATEDDSLPTIVIVGTYEDEMNHKQKGIGKMFQESLEKKNAKLISALQQYKDQLIFYNEAKQELIFPVNNMCLNNRKELSSRIRTYVTGHKKAVVTKKVPIRWYVLESNVKEEGDKEGHGIVPQALCEDIGQTLGMSKEQIFGAISFFKSLSVFLHFESCSHLVFTNPQYFLDALSCVIRVSFVDFPDMLFDKGMMLPPDAHRRIQREGLFGDDLLDLVSIKFVPGLFEKADFLHLLSDLCIIAKVQRDNATYYFIPTALPPKQLSSSEKRVFSKTCEPLILSFQHEVVPQGVFPAAVVALLNRKEPPFFTLECLTVLFPCQLRFAVKLQSKKPPGSLLLVDTMLWMEIYWTGRASECSMLRSVIMAAVFSCAKPLVYHPSALKTNPAILCNQKHHRQADMPSIHLALVDVSSDNVTVASCTVQDLEPIELMKRYQSWFVGLDKEQVNKYQTDTSQERVNLDVTDSNVLLQHEEEVSIPVNNDPCDTSLIIECERISDYSVTIGNKLDLIRLLFPIAHKWRKIGEALSIKYGDLENLCVEKNDDADRLSAVIQIWFDKQTSPVKWSTIITAVELPPVYEPCIAESIMQKFLLITQK